MNKAYYAEKGLFLGIASIICAFYFFAPTLFTFKSSLIEQSGEIRNLKTHYTRVESSRGSKSIKSELIFTLNSTQSIFVLMKNIGQSKFNERFENLEKQLKKSETATIWIKKSQKDEYQPTVFQIADSNGKIIYDLSESKSHSRFGFLISIGLGIFGIGIFINHRYSDRIKIFYEKKKKQLTTMYPHNYKGF
jgi:sugar-specific transcriptional regulator TrmB